MVSSSLNKSTTLERFYPAEPRVWIGRYNRIPGEASVFHIRYFKLMGEFWPLALSRTRNEIFSYAFAYSQTARVLTSHICRLQQRINGHPGGSFIINEYGQVLVPDANEYRRRYYVGRLMGDWKLVDPNDSHHLTSLDAEPHLRCGDVWDRPYVGMPYRLSKSDKIYFVHRLPDREEVIYPKVQDLMLIGVLRRVRKWGPMSFIVNPFGVVLTKRPDQRFTDEESWIPVYIGRVDYSRWFEFEEA